jgi:hypothetical protein
LGPFKFVSQPYTLALTPIEITQAERKLLAWWKLDETEGDTVDDSSGNNYGGMLVGGPQWQPDGGKVGGALAFDGVDDHIDCGTNVNLNLTKAVSVSAWIKLTGPAQDQKIIGNQDNTSGGYKVGIYENKLELEIRDSGNAPTQNRYVEGGTALEPDVWYHVVGTYCQGGSIKTYVNGKLDREIATPSLLGSSAGAVKIGCEPFDDLYWFKGLMDDLQIYNYPLAEADIAALYSGKGPPMFAQIEAPTVSTEEPEKKSNWIPVSVIVAVAIAVGVLIVRKRKTAA